LSATTADFLDRTVTITLGLDGSGRVDVVRAATRIGSGNAMNSSGRCVLRPRREDRRRLDLQREPGSSPIRTSAITTGSPARSNGEDDVPADRADPFSRANLRVLARRRFIQSRQCRPEIEAAEVRWLEVAEMAEQLAQGTSVA
jgi:ATP-binding cassette subfamily F protein uup